MKYFTIISFLCVVALSGCKTTEDFKVRELACGSLKQAIKTDTVNLEKCLYSSQYYSDLMEKNYVENYTKDRLCNTMSVYSFSKGGLIPEEHPIIRALDKKNMSVRMWGQIIKNLFLSLTKMNSVLYGHGEKLPIVYRIF